MTGNAIADVELDYPHMYACIDTYDCVYMYTYYMHTIIYIYVLYVCKSDDARSFGSVGTKRSPWLQGFAGSSVGVANLQKT